MGRHSREPPVVQIVVGLACVLAAVAALAWAIVVSLGLPKEAPRVSRATGRPRAVEAETTTPAQAAESSVTPAETAPHPKPPPSLDPRRVMKHIEALAGAIGVRREGTQEERRGGAYIARKLASYGYRVRTQAVPLPDGTETRNIYAVRRGTSPLEVVLGAHYDSKRPSPGANDNASGVGIVLELARVLEGRRLTPTIVFAFFGAEEMIGTDGNQHHFGSRLFVEKMSRAEKAKTAAMVSVDMVGAGDEFFVRTMGRGPKTLADTLRAFARADDIDLVYRKDPGETGWSDHEPFEEAGIPAVWLEWLQDPAYHTPGDTPEHIQLSRIRTTGRFLQRFMTRMRAGGLRRLAGANTN